MTTSRARTYKTTTPAMRANHDVKRLLRIIGSEHVTTYDRRALSARGIVEVVARWFSAPGAIERFISAVRTRQTELGLACDTWQPGPCNDQGSANGCNRRDPRAVGDYANDD